jgi:hypothetical protein
MPGSACTSAGSLCSRPLDKGASLPLCRAGSWLLAPGFEAGARFAHLQTDSNGAARVYERLGFEEFSGIDIYDGQ